MGVLFVVWRVMFFVCVLLLKLWIMVFMRLLGFFEVKWSWKVFFFILEVLSSLFIRVISLVEFCFSSFR